MSVASDWSAALARYNGLRAADVRQHVCHAPQQAMYIGRDGRVGACCLNRLQVHGQWPHQSLEDIWFGAARQSMVAQSDATALPGGCQLCTAPLRDGDVGNVMAQHFDVLARPEGGPGFPRRIDFELTNTCNLECVMCSGLYSSLIRKNREKLPPLEDIYDQRLVAQLRPFLPHLQQANFYGGEPFMVPLYLDIWEQMAQVNPAIRIVVTTNGTVLTGRVRRLLDWLDVDVVLSIDSIVPATYEAIRVNAQFDKVMANVAFFAEHAARRGRRLTFAVCPMTVNAHEIPSLVDHCTAQGILVTFNTVAHPQALSLQAWPAERLAVLLAQYEAWTGPGDTEVARHNGSRFRSLCVAVRAWHDRRATPVVAAQPMRGPVRALPQPAASLADAVARLMDDGNRGLDTDGARQAVLAHLQRLHGPKERLSAYIVACIRQAAHARNWPSQRVDDILERIDGHLDRYVDTVSIDYVLSLDPAAVVDYLASA